MHTVTGLHHVTAIAGPAQENLDFYAGILGMRLVKKSVNQDDPGTYHLFYADAEGRPGTDLTFFPWSHLAPSREGHGLSSEVSLAVPPGSLAFWAERLAHYGVTIDPVEERFGLRVLPVVDPHGLRVALVENGAAVSRPFTPWEESPVAGGASDSRSRERPLARARARADDVVSDRGARLRIARHRERLAALRRCRRFVGCVRRRPGNAHDASRRLGRGQHSSSRLACGRCRSPAGSQGTDRRGRAPADAGDRSLLVPVGLFPRTWRRCSSSWRRTVPASLSTRIRRISANRWCCRRGSKAIARRSPASCPSCRCRPRSRGPETGVGSDPGLTPVRPPSPSATLS